MKHALGDNPAERQNSPRYIPPRPARYTPTVRITRCVLHNQTLEKAVAELTNYILLPMMPTETSIVHFGQSLSVVIVTTAL